MNLKILTLLTTASILALGLGACTQGDTKTDTTPMSQDVATVDYDSHLYLEEVEGEAAIAKVKDWNAASAKRMENGLYKTLYAELLEIYNSPEKIPYVSYRNGQMHNFWRDETNVRGLWRRTTKDSYLSDAPSWTTVLDIDTLSNDEGKNWVYKGNDCKSPDYNLCLVTLSDGGKDAAEVREFNIATGEFVDGGFYMPESKGGGSWLSDDTLVIGRNFGDGTLTESGYPMVSKLWTRGMPMSEARELMRGETTDVGVWPGTFENASGDNEILVTRATTFYDTQYYWIPQTGDNAFAPMRLPVPTKVELSGQFGDQILLRLQEDWRGFSSGALVTFSVTDFMADGKIDAVHELITPTASQSIGNFGITKDGVLLSLYDNVAGSAHMFTFDNNAWASTKLNFPENGNVSIGSTNDKESIAFISSESFLQPDTLWMIDTASMQVTEAKTLPSWFDSNSMVAEQYFATSTDGTKVPYFVVHDKDVVLDGTNPTLLYGYGGFEISINPSYSATIGKAWLQRGGVYVVGNIRGGGEYGPAWHQAGLKTNRQVVYDDFIAVAEDLIARDVTTPEHLGIHGRSNGGLLMGVMFTQRPDLFNAVTIGVPLLDMQRYDKLLAGASWVGEYGDPDDTGAEGEFIRALSPYHNLKSGVEYPEPYIYTSTKDDRVHPGHARKFAARLEDMGLPFYYYENIDGGHAGAANLKETAHSQALIYSYLWTKLGGDE
ncbi:prolyl oligopeptidase family serine peptidase [Robiginitomaculum antarcticum]|uniref:prolyl oligopeptidase family serine peptidase n=1 Tax=Robiginitomaculum antarcticum TaxID=437507 RepID=UPI000361D6DB|nr:prolyl oligopeptidase family serine peptidase [Robiginitomaculum antarcticum]